VARLPCPPTSLAVKQVYSASQTFSTVRYLEGENASVLAQSATSRDIAVIMATPPPEASILEGKPHLAPSVDEVSLDAPLTR
jgi:hypothetical protein